MVNILELEKVRARIIEYPENFDYEHIICRKDKTTDDPRTDSVRSKELLQHNCNTCGCIAGFTLCSIPPSERWYDPLIQASDILGITYAERRFLFFARKPYLDDPESTYFQEYDYPVNFLIEDCSQEEGRIEALKRIDFILEHYRSLSNAVAP